MNNRWKIRGMVTAGARSVIAAGALLFLLTGLSKSMNVDEFAAAIAAQRAVPGAWAHAAATMVSTVECVTGAGTLFLLVSGRRWAWLAGWAVTVLAAGLTGYVVALWAHPPPKPAPCGCGLGHSALVSDWSGLALRDAGLTTGLLFAALLASMRKGAPAGREVADGLASAPA